MAYKLRATTLTAKFSSVIAVDPDTGTIKDFVSAAVTADMTVGANVTIGSQAWNGTTRSYFKQGSGVTAADFVVFGTNKPPYRYNAASPKMSVVFIGEVAGQAARVFGNNSSDYFCSISMEAGGNTYPWALFSGTAQQGALTRLAAGAKVIFGWSYVRTGSGTPSLIYANTHDNTSRNVIAKAAATVTVSYDLTYIGRTNEETGHQQDKIHVILIAIDQLTADEFDALQADWFSVLLEQEAAVAPTATITATTENTTFFGACTGYVAPSSCTIAATAANATFSGTATGSTGLPSLTTPPLKNNTGTLLASLSGWTVNVYNASTGALVLRKTGLSTDAAGVLTITDAALVSGTTYAYEPVHATYGRRLPTLAAT